jgi:ubiquinone/menaquinone biosynthesis C-methylase UbiE
MSKKNIWNFKNGSVSKNAPQFIHYPFGHIVRSSFATKYFRYGNFDFSNHTSANERIKVLDIGTYKLHNLYPFNIRGCTLFATGVNKYDVKMAKEIAKKNKCNVQIRMGHNRKLPFKNNYFDHVMSINTLHYEESLVNIKKSLIEFKRVCKHNGVVTIDIPTKKHHFFKGCKKIKQNIYKYLDKKDIRNNNYFFFFDNKSNIKKIFLEYFNIVEIATITEKYPKMNLEWHHVRCIK